MTDNKIEVPNKFTEQFLNKRIIVKRYDESEREVEIMFDRNTKKYAYVNDISYLFL